MPFPYAFPFWFDVSVKYTSAQRVRYQTGLLTADDMDDSTINTIIEQAEALIDTWAKRDGVNPETWKQSVPMLVVHAATLKSAEMVLARKVFDGRITSTESRSGASMRSASGEGPAYLGEEAKKIWADYLLSSGKRSPTTQKFQIPASLSVFHESTWRKKKKTAS